MGASFTRCRECFGTPPHEYQPLTSTHEPLASKPPPSPAYLNTASTESASVELHENEFDLPELEAMCEEAEINFFELLDSLDASRFALNYDKDGIRVLTADTERSFLLWAVFDMPCSAPDFMSFVKNIQARVEWDSNLQDAKVVCKVNENTFVTHQTYRGVLTVKARDLLVLSCYRTYKGSPCEVSRSIRSPHYPERNTCVRAILHLGGYLAEPTGENTCRVTCVNETDLGGALPKIIVKKLSALAFPTFVKNVKVAMSRITS